MYTTYRANILAATLASNYCPCSKPTALVEVAMHSIENSRFGGMHKHMVSNVICIVISILLDDDGSTVNTLTCEKNNCIVWSRACALFNSRDVSL